MIQSVIKFKINRFNKGEQKKLLFCYFLIIIYVIKGIIIITTGVATLPPQYYDNSNYRISKCKSFSFF